MVERNTYLDYMFYFHINNYKGLENISKLYEACLDTPHGTPLKVWEVKIGYFLNLLDTRGSNAFNSLFKLFEINNVDASVFKGATSQQSTKHEVCYVSKVEYSPSLNAPMILGCVKRIGCLEVPKINQLTEVYLKHDTHVDWLRVTDLDNFLSLNPSEFEIHSTIRNSVSNIHIAKKYGTLFQWI